MLCLIIETIIILYFFYSVEMKIDCRHISANANPKTNVIQFLDSSHICFGFSNQLGVYSITEKKILFTIHDIQVHHLRVNCISLISLQKQKLVLCGYESGYLVGYYISNNQWRKAFSIKDNSALVSIVNYSIGGEHHIFTNNNSSYIKYYKLQGQKLVLKEELQYPLNKIIESIAVSSAENKLMVFMGGIDQKIHYYQLDLSNQESTLSYKFSLSGHQNSITKLVISKDSNSNELLLASASKDGYIRLWKITDNLQELKFHKNVYSILSNSIAFLEAVLISHECSVTSLCWVHFEGVKQLASASLDCTVCLWGNGTEGAWTVDSRLGQFLGNKNAYFDVISDQNSAYLLALNYTGAAILWERKDGKFILNQCFNGHSNLANSIEWNHTGDYLVSVSKDQTTRVITQNKQAKIYREISRAQIHGYDINAVSVIKVKDNTIDVIICGAEQKVIRVLEPPACFANYLNTFTEANLHLYFNSEQEENKYKISKPQDKILLYEAYSEGGTQVLGLMTKAQRVEKEKITNYYDEQQAEDEQQVQVEEVKAVKLDYDRPPHEDYLVKHTLWPENNKLYGHPNEIQTLCRSRVSKRMASSCNALNKEAASVIVWNTEDWKILKILTLHRFTVFALAFSYNDKYFATVSKDRILAVYSGSDLKLLFNYEAHLRTITSVSFHVSEEFILTGSRDKTIRLHSLNDQKQISQLNFQNPVTSVAFCEQKGFQDYFAVGCSNGAINIGKIQQHKLILLGKVEQKYSHTESVNQIKWNKSTFASCSDDFSVRIFDVTF